MSEFVDPIKNVKKKVKLLDEASKVIKSSLRQQLEHQREIKGLEVAKTEEYAKQAKPIVEAVGTLPSEEEKRLAKENDRSIVIQDMIDAGIPSYDPSYNIILKLFDDSYDTIKSRKTDSLKQKGVDMMVSSVDSLLTDNDYFPIPTPIGQLSKNIFEKVFLNKDYTLSDMLKTNVKLHEEMIVDREQTEAERSQVEAEKKVEEEKKAVEAEAEKAKAEKSDEELRRIEEENKVNKNVKDLMFNIYVSRLREQGMNIEKSPFRSQLKNAFEFIHPYIITETDENNKVLKINDLINSEEMKKKVSSQQVRNNIKKSLLRTYTKSIISSTTSKTEKDGLISDIKKIAPTPAPAPAPVVPPILTTASSDSSIPPLVPLVTPVSTPEPAPAPVPATPIKPKVDVVPATPEVEPVASESKSDDPKRIDTYFLKNRDNVAKSGSGKVFKHFSGFKNKVNREMVKEWSANDRLYFQIRATKQFIDLQNKEPDTPSKNKAIIEAKEFMDKSLSNFVDNEELKNLSREIAKPILGKGLKKGKAQKGGFNFLNMMAPVPLFGDGLTMEDLRTKTSSGVKKKLGLVGNGMTILNPKNFQKGMKKKSNEDLLHNLQVHMAEVQAGNNNLKEPIKMLVNEAMGRGIMKKQVGNKIIKNFS